jgi:glycosyltransferase 2 family protein
MMSAARRLHPWLTGRAFRATVGIGLLVLLLVWVDLGAMIAAIRQVRLDLLALLVATIFAARLVSGLRWYVLLRGLHRAVSYTGVLRLTFVSDFIGYFSPGSLGIDALRLYGMSRTTSDLALSATSMLVERMLAFLALIVLVLVGLAFQLPVLPPEIGRLAWIGLALLVLVLVGLMAPPFRCTTLWLLSHPRLTRLHSGAQKVYRSLDQYRARPVLLAGSFAIAVIFQLMRCAQTAIGAAAFGVHLPFLLYVVIMPVIILITLLPISIAGLGVRELGFVYLFGQVGMPAEIALPLSLLTRVLTVLLAVPGAWFYARRGVLA